LLRLSSSFRSLKIAKTTKKITKKSRLHLESRYLGCRKTTTRRAR
jgi:hypothetical protein